MAGRAYNFAARSENRSERFRRCTQHRVRRCIYVDFFLARRHERDVCCSSSTAEINHSLISSIDSNPRRTTLGIQSYIRFRDCHHHFFPSRWGGPHRPSLWPCCCSRPSAGYAVLLDCLSRYASACAFVVPAGYSYGYYIVPPNVWQPSKETPDLVDSGTFSRPLR